MPDPMTTTSPGAATAAVALPEHRSVAGAAVRLAAWLDTRPIAPVDRSVLRDAEEAVAGLAVPPGALGVLGTLAVQLCGIAGQLPAPVPERARVIVAAADHGVHAQQVTPWPQALSRVIAETVAAGRAGVSAVAAAVGADVEVVDVGLTGTPSPDSAVADRRVVAATRDLSVTDAMTRDEAAAAVLVGARLTAQALDDGCDLVVLGDVGLGNTTASAALIGAYTGTPAAQVTGPGSGADADMRARKQDVVARALDRAGVRAPLDTLAALGGAEHAALAGVVLAAASRRVPVLLDGVIADAAALAAVALLPDARHALIAGHRSPEPGADVALTALGLRPLLALDMRLGEGSAGALAVPLVQAAARLLHDVARLQDLGAAPDPRG